MNKLLLILFLTFSSQLFSQQPGIDKPGWERDTNIIFRSPRPLLDSNDLFSELKNRFQVDFAFSVHGFGLGLGYGKKITEYDEVFFNIMISEARASDELEFFDWVEGRYLVPNKINRLMMIPISAGYKKYLFADSFEGNLKPYVSGAVTLNYINSRPYRVDRDSSGAFVPFFESFGGMENYFKFGGYAEIGFDFSPLPKQNTSIMMRYYYVPFSEGLESIKSVPVTNFGGLFISLSIGLKF